MGILVLFLFKYLQLFSVEYDVCYILSYMAFIMLRYVPSIPTLLRIFIDWTQSSLRFFIKCYGMFLKLFLYLLRWSYDFFPLIYWCEYRFTCACWTILASQCKILLDHDVWSFSCIVEFSLLIFCWAFCIYVQSVILICNFFFVVSWSVFGIRLVLASEYKEGMHQKATNQTSCFRCEVAFSCSFI